MQDSEISFDGNISTKERREESYKKYLDGHGILGTYERYPECRIHEKHVVRKKCINWEVDVEVYIGTLHYTWDGGSVEFPGAWTSEVRVGHKLMLGGFGSQAFIDEGNTMREAIVDVC